MELFLFWGCPPPTRIENRIALSEGEEVGPYPATSDIARTGTVECRKQRATGAIPEFDACGMGISAASAADLAAVAAADGAVGVPEAIVPES